MIHDPSAPAVVLSPHPDDAVLSAWSVLSRPGAVVVVNVCAGIPPAGTLGDFDPVFGATDSSVLVQQRLAEDADALSTVGRPSRNLDLLEVQYRGQPVSPDRIRTAIAGSADEVGSLVAPAGIGAHPDHVLVRDAALAIAAEVGIPIALYADLPYAIWAGWPHWVTGREPRPYLVPDARWRADLESIPVPDRALVARPCELGEAEAARKLAAIRLYRSQFEALNAGPVARLTNPEVIGYELHWDVRI
ncbi:MAG: PIG-L deacetylase family protein [Acidimicrobiia bacterium]